MKATINLYCEDCLPAMRKMADNQYSLCICDPPYGLNITQFPTGSRKTVPKETHRTWDDNIPSVEYFNELFRVSKNQIIWGGNFFPLPPNRHYLIWDKGETMYNRSFAECEYAWTSFDESPRIFKKSPNQLDRIHVCQKPVALYKWLLKNYAKEGDKILDTHFGSLSIGIACWDYGFDLDAYEIDKDYFEAGEKRFETHKAQLQLY